MKTTHEVHLVVKVEHQDFGRHRNGKMRTRQIALFACKRAVYGGLRTDSAAFTKRCTSDIYQVSCPRCIHEAKQLGIEKLRAAPPKLPPPVPVFDDPWADEDTPIGATR